MRKILFAAAAAAALFALPDPVALAQTTTTVVTPLPPAYVGRPIVNAQGQVVGTISEIRDNRVYVTADQYLGVGQRIYVFPQDKIVVTGAGEQVRIVTPMTREQIIVLPSP